MTRRIQTSTTNAHRRITAKRFGHTSPSCLTWGNILPQLKHLLNHSEESSTTITSNKTSIATPSNKISAPTISPTMGSSDWPSAADDIPWSEDYSCTGEFLQREECFVEHCPGKVHWIKLIFSDVLIALGKTAVMTEFTVRRSAGLVATVDRSAGDLLSFHNAADNFIFEGIDRYGKKKSIICFSVSKVK